MSSSDEDQIEVEALPPNRIRFTDMPTSHVDKAIRRKYITIQAFIYKLKLSFLIKHLMLIVCLKATEKCKLDKELATEIQTQIKADPELQDETAGWHVVTGKSFASAITYKTSCVLFFDLLDGHHKSFLMFKT